MDSVDVLVVGAGQAGLATAHRLQQTDLSCQVWEARARVGAAWDDRWDSLRLFTPRRFSALPGLPFPDGPGECPTRAEMADYLRRYAGPLPVRTSRPVTSLVHDGTAFVADGGLRARHVVVATGPFSSPWTPPAAQDLQVPQLHAAGYHRPADLPAGPVTVVGGGDSAAQLALELSRNREVTVVAGREPWFLPAHVGGLSTYTWLQVLGVLRARADGPVARAVRRRGDPVFGTDLREAVRAGGVTLLPRRVVGAGVEELLLDDGSHLPVTSVLWCTGYRARYPWLDVAGALDEQGQPVHHRGASPVPGLHWVGLPWLRRLDSSIVHGAGPDAGATVSRILRDSTSATPRGTNLPS